MEEMLVDCGEHGKRLGYMVCNHIVEEGYPIFHAEPSCVERIGVACCEECYDIRGNREEVLKRFKLVCIKCLQDNFLDTWPDDVPLVE